MALPITVPYTFGNATTAIPLSNLDSDYATVYQAVNGIGNGSVALANVTISGVSTPITATQGGTGNSSVFTANAVVYAPTTSTLATGSALTFDGSNLGIGTTSPGQKLDISTSSDIQARIGNSVTGAQFTYDIGRVAASGLLQFYGNQSGATGYIFSGINGERMRIDSSGNLLVGVTSAYRSGQSAISSSSQYGLRIQPTSASNGIAFEINAPNVTSSTSSYLIAVSSANSDRMYCYSNGNIVNVNNSYGTLSDVKLKDNIINATPKLADVMQLKVRNFNLKTDPDHKQIGFIAQELEEVFPALIDNTSSPNNPNDITKSIKTSVLVPILVKAIQELSAKVTALEAKLGV